MVLVASLPSPRSPVWKAKQSRCRKYSSSTARVSIKTERCSEGSGPPACDRGSQNVSRFTACNFRVRSLRRFKNGSASPLLCLSCLSVFGVCDLSHYITTDRSQTCPFERTFGRRDPRVSPFPGPRSSTCATRAAERNPVGQPRTARRARHVAVQKVHRSGCCRDNSHAPGPVLVDCRRACVSRSLDGQHV